jgi:CheY-like chemotaxis protein
VPLSDTGRLFHLLTENDMNACLAENREPASGPLRLLVVESDLPRLELITRALSSLKAQVFPVNDSREAVVLVNNKKFDGVFLALEMPCVGGLELTAKVRASSWNRSTAVIALGSRDQPSAMQQAFEAGATFYFHQPMDEQKLAGLFHTVRGTLLEARCRYARVPLQTEVICSVGPRILSVTSLNLGMGGVQVDAGDLKGGETVGLSFRLPISNVRIEGFGVVVSAEGNRRAIQFTKVSGQSTSEIRRFITQVEQQELLAG